MIFGPRQAAHYQRILLHGADEAEGHYRHWNRRFTVAWNNDFLARVGPVLGRAAIAEAEDEGLRGHLFADAGVENHLRRRHLHNQIQVVDQHV